jgi:hypothetical protein
MGNGTLMIIGLGDLGGYVLEFLAREPNMPKIVTADINEDWGVRKTNSAIYGALQFNLYPNIEFIHLDAFDVNGTANLLREIQPSVIYNSMTLQSWWVITRLPQEAYKAIDETRYGPWYPMHFVPAYKLMQAVQKSGIKTHVINAAFPDVVNPALAMIGLAPTVGIGNIDNLVCALKLIAAKTFQAPLRSTAVYMVAPHFISYYMSRFGHCEGAPYYLKVMIDDKDVTSRLKKDEFFASVTTFAKRPGSLHAHPVVASSACRIIKGILFDTNEIGHAPGPCGLPGGYPIRMNTHGVEILLPDGLSLEEAIRLNNEAQKFDSIDSIKEDGTVVISDRAAKIFKKLLDFDCKEYTVQNSEAKARELDEKFKRWAATFK